MFEHLLKISNIGKTPGKLFSFWCYHGKLKKSKEIFCIKLFNPFHAIGLFLYPLKTSENLRFFDVFRGYRKRPVAWKGLNSFQKKIINAGDMILKNEPKK